MIPSLTVLVTSPPSMSVADPLYMILSSMYEPHYREQQPCSFLRVKATLIAHRSLYFGARKPL